MQMIGRTGYQRLAREIRLDSRRATSDLREALLTRQLDPAEFSIRSLAEHLVPDGREWVESMNPRFGGATLLESGGQAVSTGDFSNITGQIIYSKVLQGYMPEQMVFSGLVETIPTTFDGEKIPGIGGIGDKASVVGEGQPFPNVGLNEDYIETPSTTKRGMILPITKEAIFFDRTNRILQEAGRCGEFLAVNKERRIINALIDENETTYRYKWKGTAYTSYVASGGHGVINLKASNELLDWTDIDNALALASAITDPSTGEPVINMGSDFIVCPQLAMRASFILNATQVQTATPGFATTGNPNTTFGNNPLMGVPGYTPAAYNLRTSRLLAVQMATDTSWFIGDIRKTVAYMENWPITVAQAPANSEAEFTNDVVLRFKASERGTPTVLDVRYMIKSTVA